MKYFTRNVLPPLLALALILCVALALTIRPRSDARRADTSEPTAETDPAALALSYQAADGAVIRPQTVGGYDYLFLPSSADCAALALQIADGAELTGTAEGAALTADGSPLDLTRLFGAMEPGGRYPLHLADGSAQYDYYVMRSANLPSLHVTLDGKLDYLHADKSNRLPGSLVKLSADGGVEVSAELKQMKGRGNSSWSRSGEKRPYNLKLAEKQELIPGAGAAKNWCLLSNNAHDRTGLYSFFALELYRAIGGASALDDQSVDLYINGEYRGVYQLTEKVEIHPERVAVAEPKNADETVTPVKVEGAADDAAIAAGIAAYQYAEGAAQERSGGFLLEMDRHYEKEPCWFKTKRGAAFVVKEPEYATREQVQRIAVYVQELEDALFSDTGYNARGKRLTDYADPESLARLYLLDCLTMQGDMMRSSAFWYIDAQEDGTLRGKLMRGPAWDYDYIDAKRDRLLPRDLGSRRNRNSFGCTLWATQLLTDGEFLATLSRVGEETVLSALDGVLEDALPRQAEALTSAMALNDVLWDGRYAEEKDAAIAVFAQRRADWPATLWNPETKLLGVTAERGENALRSALIGTATAYQWYRVDADDPTQREAIPGATGAEYVPTEPGEYFVTATGGNVCFNADAAEHPEEFTLGGIQSLVTQPELTARSNVVAWR